MLRILLTPLAFGLVGVAAAHPHRAHAVEPAYVGRWATERSICFRDPRQTEGEEVATRIGRTGMTGNEESCTFKRVTPIRDRDGRDELWEIDALCVAEGIVSRARFTLRVDSSGRLRQEYPGNGKTETALPTTRVRCP